MIERHGKTDKEHAADIRVTFNKLRTVLAQAYDADLKIEFSDRLRHLLEQPGLALWPSDIVVVRQL